MLSFRNSKALWTKCDHRRIETQTALIIGFGMIHGWWWFDRGHAARVIDYDSPTITHAGPPRWMDEDSRASLQTFGADRIVAVNR